MFDSLKREGGSPVAIGLLRISFHLLVEWSRRGLESLIGSSFGCDPGGGGAGGLSYSLRLNTFFKSLNPILNSKFFVVCKGYN